MFVKALVISSCGLETVNEYNYEVLTFSPSGRYFPEDEEEEGPSISAIISQHLQQMTQAMSDNVTTKTMLDVESKVTNSDLSYP